MPSWRWVRRVPDQRFVTDGDSSAVVRHARSAQFVLYVGDDDGLLAGVVQNGAICSCPDMATRNTWPYLSVAFRRPAPAGGVGSMLAAGSRPGAAGPGTSPASC